MHLSTVILEYKNSSSPIEEADHQMECQGLRVPVQIHKTDGKNCHQHVLFFNNL